MKYEQGCERRPGRAAPGLAGLRTAEPSVVRVSRVLCSLLLCSLLLCSLLLGACTLGDHDFVPLAVTARVASPPVESAIGRDAGDVPDSAHPPVELDGAPEDTSSDSSECLEAACIDPIIAPSPPIADCGAACAVSCADGPCGPDAGPACLPTEPGCTSTTSGSGSGSGSGSCDDRQTNGREILADCGGGECPGCPSGTPCQSDADCASARCGPERLCTPPACNAVMDGAGAAPDCGGADTSCPRCSEGRSCRLDDDCASRACESGRCCGGSLGDCTRCAERLSATRNCSGAPEGGASDCADFLSCLTANASVCSSRSAPGCTDDPGGVCNHNTFGGNDGLGVRHAAEVLAEAGCLP